MTYTQVPVVRVHSLAVRRLARHAVFVDRDRSTSRVRSRRSASSTAGTTATPSSCRRVAMSAGSSIVVTAAPEDGGRRDTRTPAIRPSGSDLEDLHDATRRTVGQRRALEVDRDFRTGDDEVVERRDARGIRRVHRVEHRHEVLTTLMAPRSTGSSRYGSSTRLASHRVPVAGVEQLQVPRRRPRSSPGRSWALPGSEDVLAGQNGCRYRGTPGTAAPAAGHGAQRRAECPDATNGPDADPVLPPPPPVGSRDPGRGRRAVRTPLAQRRPRDVRGVGTASDQQLVPLVNLMDIQAGAHVEIERILEEPRRRRASRASRGSSNGARRRR